MVLLLEKRRSKMKKQVICILCHNKPEQVNFIIDSLPEYKFDFIIHVDKKSEIYNEIIQKSNVKFCNRVNVKWGRFSQVQATLEMFKIIDANKYSYVHLISGSDFIIKTPEYLYAFFADNHKEYMQCNILPGATTWGWGGMDRFQVYYPQWIIRRPKNKVFRFIRVAYREFIMRTKIFKQRRSPVKDFYGGSSWFSITGECLVWMMNYLKGHSEYINFYKHGFCVEEVFFATLLMMSPFADNLVNNPMRFMIWEGSTTGGPMELKENHLPLMKKSECVFARKFAEMQTIRLVHEQLCK